MQLGKNGITENFIETLKRYFENHEQVRLSVLKSARENREDMKKHSEEILKKLNSQPRSHDPDLTSAKLLTSSFFNSLNFCIFMQ